METKQKKSPVMTQYKNLKEKHPDALLLFRCGDFYETYEDDAKAASKILGITLTSVGDNEPKSSFDYMTGFPYYALDNYLPKLIRAGKRVAICDQLEEPKPMAVVSSPKEEQKPQHPDKPYSGVSIPAEVLTDPSVEELTKRLKELMEENKRLQDEKEVLKCKLTYQMKVTDEKDKVIDTLRKESDLYYGKLIEIEANVETAVKLLSIYI